MRRNAKPKILLSLLGLAMIAALVGGGTTLASFTATATNPSNAFTTSTVTLNDVAGTVISGTNCTTDTYNGACATLFAASNTAMLPGAADKTNTATITYKGAVATTSFRLYVLNYTSNITLSTLCAAANTASKINLQIKQGSTIIYPVGGSGYGTLDAFATTYTTNANGLSLRGGTNGLGTAGIWNTNDSSVFTINVNLDSTADSTYQNCKAQTDLVWYASQ